MRTLPALSVCLATAAGVLSVTGAQAQDTQAQEAAVATMLAPASFEPVLFLLSGMLVLIMAAGFTLRAVGLAGADSAAKVCLKHVALYGVAVIMVWLTGHNIIYNVASDGLLTPFVSWWGWQPSGDRSAHTGWYFQMVFAAIAAAVVAGALAERIKLGPLLIFVFFLSGFVYPIQASWHWGQGYLFASWNFADFGGATVIHATGGWAALAGAVVLGPRAVRTGTRKDDLVQDFSLPLLTLGTVILWLGWFGLLGGSYLVSGSAAEVDTLVRIILNVNLSAAAGVLSALMLSAVLHKEAVLMVALNGAVGGLVSISAEPLLPAMWQSLVIGAVGGVIVALSIPILRRFRIDDAVGAIPAHLFCGVWGTLVVVWSHHAGGDGGPTILGQLAGMIMVGIFVFTVSSLLWLILKYAIGIRAVSGQGARR